MGDKMAGMNKKKIFYWLPRILGIIYIGFIGIFALDVFTPEATLAEALGGLVIHLIPNYLLAAALFIAWRKNEAAGAALFLGLAVIFWFWFGNPVLVNLMLFGPLVIIACLFFVNYYFKPRI